MIVINLKALPERWAINLIQERRHPRINQFKRMFNRTFCENENDSYGFRLKYYGYNIHPNRPIESFRHYGKTLPKGVTLITLDEFFKTQEADLTYMFIGPNNKPVTIFFFDPKEDITSFELAKCLSFSNFSNFVSLDEGFFPDEPFMRHFKQVR